MYGQCRYVHWQCTFYPYLPLAHNLEPCVVVKFFSLQTRTVLNWIEFVHLNRLKTNSLIHYKFTTFFRLPHHGSTNTIQSQIHHNTKPNQYKYIKSITIIFLNYLKYCQEELSAFNGGESILPFAKRNSVITNLFQKVLDFIRKRISLRHLFFLCLFSFM